MHDDESVGRILEDWHQRLAGGAVEDPADLIRTHPEHADALRRAFEGLLESPEGEVDVETAPRGPRPAPPPLPAALSAARPPPKAPDEPLDPPVRPALTTFWSLEGVASRNVARAVAGMADDAVTTLARADQVPLDGENESALLASSLLPVLVLGSPGIVPRVRIRLLHMAGTLAEAIEEAERNPESRPRVLGAIAVLADTLDLAHAEDIVHGALDPMDVMLGEGGEVVIRGYGRVVAPSRAADLQALSGVLAMAVPESEAPALAALAYRLASANAEGDIAVTAGEVAAALRRFLEARAAEAVAAARRRTIQYAIGSARAFGGDKALSGLQEAIAECDGLIQGRSDDMDARDLKDEAEALKEELEASQAALLERHRREAERAEQSAVTAAVEEAESRREKDLSDLEHRLVRDARALQRRAEAAERGRKQAITLVWIAAAVAVAAAVAIASLAAS